MSAAALLARLRQAGVNLAADGGALRYSAPKGVMTPELRAELARHKPELLRLLCEGGATARLTRPPFEPAPRCDVIPLSFVQERLWFVDQLEPESTAYNIPLAFELTGELDLAALECCYNEILRRHEVLRTTCHNTGGQPLLRVEPFSQTAIPVMDLRGLPEPDRRRTAQKLTVNEARRRFDLGKAPFLHISLLRLDEQEHVLLLTTHHFVADGWSMRVLLRELSAFYGSFVSGLPQVPPPPAQYRDFAYWQRRCLEWNYLEDQLSYWKEKLKGAPATLNLPADCAAKAANEDEGAILSFELHPRLSEAIRAVSRGERVTLFTTLLAGFQTLLYRYTHQDDIVVGTSVSSRNRHELEGLIGNFSNNLPLRTNFAGNPRFRELLSEVRQTVLGGLTHQDFPFERLVQELHPDRDSNRAPLLQTMFILHQDAPQDNLRLPGLRIRELPADRGAARFDLTLSMLDGTDGMKGRFEYRTSLFGRDFILRMAGHFQTLLEGIAADPDQHVSDIPILKEIEQRQILVEWNQTEADYPQTRCLHQVFEEQVAKTPDATAVVFEDIRLSYVELNCRANQLAHHLRGLGAGSDTLVGLFTERCVEMVIGLLAVLKAGGGYVPLDPAHPKERLAFMLEDAGAPVVLTLESLAVKLPETGAQVVVLEREWQSISRESPENPHTEVTAEDLAYVIYTSGSTGKPKGVAVEHRQVLNYALGVAERLQLTPRLSYAMVQPLAFDISGTMIYPSLLSGGVLHVISRERSLDPYALGDYFERHGIDCLKITPGHLAALTASPRAERVFPRRRLILGGEASHWDRVEKSLALAPHCAIFNHYGPTETTIGVTTYRVEAHLNRGSARTVPIGRPLPNTQAYILDRQMRPVPIGVTGELCFGGRCVTRGYIHHPELTARQFVPNPFNAHPGARLYKTGDLGRYLPDGNIEFLGRIDDQIKIRGFRVEGGDVEEALVQHPAVREAAVVARQDETGEDRLVSYVVPRSGKAPTSGELLRFLAQKLPAHMIPASFVFLPALPRTPHGKLQREALPQPEWKQTGSECTPIAPRTATEEAVARIWRQVLGAKRLGVRDNFFDLGGHSLQAPLLCSQLEKAFGRQIPVATLFRAPTVEGLAAMIDGAGHSNQSTTVVPLSPAGSLPPLFCVHPATGEVLIFRQLARRLGADWPVYGLQPVGLDGSEHPLATLEEMAARYIRDIRVIQPRGPYHLVGLCCGAFIALDMAHQLQAQGEEVALLAALNADASWVNVKSLQDGVRYHLRSLDMLNLEGKLRYLSTRVRYRIRRIVHGVVEMLCGCWLVAGRPLPGALRRVHISGLTHRAGVLYVPRVFRGKVIYFQSSEDTHLDPTVFWSQVATEGVETRVIAARSLSTLREPNVAALAESMRAYLQHH